MDRIEGYMAAARASAARCATRQDAIEAGRAHGRQVAADVARWEADNVQPHGSHRWDIEAAFARGIEEAGTAPLADFLDAALTTFKAELKALG